MRVGSVIRSFISQSGGDVSDLLGTEHGMDRNKDRVGPKDAQDRDDLIKRLLHANADAVAR